ncbi:nucleoside phosphorylase [Streptomyces sp. NPDC085479]|uniref:nucleoside phosphorylase n=1 Tax=Streptomyces sp. NPDC085479 TaxID=3365726 RepID=UPI0037D049BB
MIHPNLPLHPGKHALPAVADPAEHARHVRTRAPEATLADHDGAVLVYQDRVLAHTVANYGGRRTDWVRGNLRLIERRSRRLAVCGGFGPGAPAAALVLEQLLSLGIRRVITVGTAASLHVSLTPGSLVVCTRALRDDDLSHHYLPPGPYADPSPGLTRHLVGALHARDAEPRQGKGWTTSAVYRETAAEVARYGALGALTADMEAAGVFAVAEHRGADAAAVLAVADSLAERRPRRDHPRTEAALHIAVEASLAALTAAAREQPHD